MIEVSGVTKYYGEVRAVNEINFKIEPGEIVGFLGPNGAGKTTTMRILTCYLPMDAGKVTVAGHDVLEESLAVRSKIGYLPENAPLYTDMTVSGFLDYVAAVRGIPTGDRSSAKTKITKVCGLSTVLEKQIGELSKGYRQRVGLAQAMIHNPDILILDEPTSGLDPNQIREIRELIKELGEKKTVILSTHILPEVEATCDRVIIINQGKIVSDGSVAEVSAGSLGASSYHVLIRGEVAKIESGFKTIRDIASFKQTGQESGLWRYEISARKEAQLGEQIFRMAADSGLSLAELTREKASLEEAFKDLTKTKE